MIFQMLLRYFNGKIFVKSFVSSLHHLPPFFILNSAGSLLLLSAGKSIVAPLKFKATSLL